MTLYCKVGQPVRFMHFATASVRCNFMSTSRVGQPQSRKQLTQEHIFQNKITFKDYGCVWYEFHRHENSTNGLGLFKLARERLATNILAGPTDGAAIHSARELSSQHAGKKWFNNAVTKKNHSEYLPVMQAFTAVGFCAVTTQLYDISYNDKIQTQDKCLNLTTVEKSFENKYPGSTLTSCCGLGWYEACKRQQILNYSAPVLWR